MDKTSFASMLFFTRAAVRRDPALASTRLGGPFAAIAAPLEQELGRSLTADERRVFVAAVEEATTCL